MAAILEKPIMTSIILSSGNPVGRLAVAFGLALAAVSSAASLTWGPSGAGGSGTWNANCTANWFNGTSAVKWPAPGGTDDDAVFAGTSGTVSLATGGITANDLTFNTTGYIIQSQTLTLNGTTPTITAGTGDHRGNFLCHRRFGRAHQGRSRHTGPFRCQHLHRQRHGFRRAAASHPQRQLWFGK